MKYFFLIFFSVLFIQSTYSSDANKHNTDELGSPDITKLQMLEKKLDRMEANMSIPDTFDKACLDCCLGGNNGMVTKQFCEKKFSNSWNNRDCPCSKKN